MIRKLKGYITFKPGVDELNIKPGQESKYWDEAFDCHAEITIDKLK